MKILTMLTPTSKALLILQWTPSFLGLQSFHPGRSGPFVLFKLSFLGSKSFYIFQALSEAP